MRRLIPTCPYISCPIFTLLYRTAIAYLKIAFDLFSLLVYKHLEHHVCRRIGKCRHICAYEPSKKRIQDSKAQLNRV